MLKVAHELHDVIRASGGFTSLTEVSHFAHSAVIVMRHQRQRLDAQEARLAYLERLLEVRPVALSLPVTIEVGSTAIKDCE